MTFKIFRRHAGMAALADAYVDGELAAADLGRFESHLAGCEKCAARVAAARELKASVASLPELAAPRSFRLTPAMAMGPRPVEARQRPTPVYLGLARAGAAVAVGAFATLAAVAALDSDEDGGDDAGASRQSAPAFEAIDTGALTDGGDSEKAAPTEASPQLAPPRTPGAAGASVESPTPPPATPVAPRTGIESTPVAGGGAPHDTGAEPSPGVASSEPFADAVATADDDEGTPWLVWSGALAAVSLGVLGFIEVRRRVRRG